MSQKNASLSTSRMDVILLILSILAVLFWFTAQLVDVYSIAFVGALFEIFWLPMLALLFALPVLSLLFWWRTRFSIRSLYFYSFLLSFIAVLLLIFGAV
jgi:hypothetical protein